MPLVYERAYGGVDPKSDDAGARTGTGATRWARASPSQSRNAQGLQLPNIEDPKQLIGSWDDRPAPAGFGAIASHWQPRVGFAGTYDEHWMKTRQPLLAEDMDDRWFQCAPADQQAPEFLRGGEPVVLHNLQPARAACEFTLPQGLSRLRDPLLRRQPRDPQEARAAHA